VGMNSLLQSMGEFNSNMRPAQDRSARSRDAGTTAGMAGQEDCSTAGFRLL
jgi:hypothetical protein